MSASRENQAYQEKAKIIQKIYRKLKAYAEHLKKKYSGLYDTGASLSENDKVINKKLAAINELIYKIAVVVDPNNKKSYNDKQDLYSDTQLEQIINNLLMNPPTSHISVGGLDASVQDAKKSDSIMSKIDQLLKTDLPDLLEMERKFKQTDKKEEKLSVQQHLKKRRDSHDRELDNQIRNFFDKMSHGLFAKVSGRKVVKEIKAQLKLFDQQVKDRAKAEKAEEKRQERDKKKTDAKADAKTKAQERKKKEEAKKQRAKEKREERRKKTVERKYSF